MFTGRIILLLISFFIITFLIINNEKWYKSASTLCAIYVSSILYYCIVPLVIYLFSEDIERIGFVEKIYNASFIVFLRGWTCVLLFIITVSFFHRQIYNKNRKYLRNQFEVTHYKSLVLKFVIFCASIGGVCFFLYVHSFGSIAAMLEQAELLRSFSHESNMSYITKIFVFPARLVVLVPIFLLLYKENRKFRGGLYTVLFISSFFIGLLYYLNNAGKTGVAIYFMALLVPILYRYSKSAWKIVILLGAFSISLVGYLDNFFLYFTTGLFYDVSGSSFLDYINQFAYPSSNVMSLDGIIYISGYRYGLDIITGFLNQIPGINFPISFEFTSEFYGGKLWREGGGTPTDSVSFGYMQLGYLGVVLWGVIVGSVSGWADCMIKKLGTSFGKEFFKATLILAFFVLTTNADVYIIIRSQFSLWVLLLFLYFIYKRNKKRIHCCPEKFYHKVS